MIEIELSSPLAPELALLHERHTVAMHADTPPESIHMLPASELATARAEIAKLQRVLGKTSLENKILKEVNRPGFGGGPNS